MVGCAFEFYVYERFPDLQGRPDWTLGEDSGKGMLILRDLADPTSTVQKQPKYYRAAYWVDPNATADYGGVHTNSGVGNHCFYLYCAKTNVQSGIALFVNALRTLKTTANYLDFRDALKRSAGTQIAIMQEVLNIVGLTDTMVNDWTKAPAGLLEPYEVLVQQIAPNLEINEEDQEEPDLKKHKNQE